MAALVSVGSQMEKIKAEGEGTHLDVHLGRERRIDAWVERERPDRENVATHVSAQRDMQRWVSRTECEAMYGGVAVSSWAGADVEPTRVNPAQEIGVEREIDVEPQEDTDEDRWNAWVKEYEARPGWGETEDNEPAAVVTATTKPASIPKPNEESFLHKEEATSVSKPENTHQSVTQIPLRKVETAGIKLDKQESIKESVPCTSHSHVSDVQALDSIEKLLYQEMGAPKIQPIVSPPKSDVPAEVRVHLKTAGLGSISNMQARGLSPKESLPGEATPAGSSGACVQRVQAPEKNRNKIVEEYDIGAETPLLRHLKSSRFERRGRIVEYSPLPLRSLKSDGHDRNLTTSEPSPRLLQKSKTPGSKSSRKDLPQYAYGGFTESGRTRKPVINSEVSPGLLQNLKTAGFGSSDERNYQGGHGGLRESSIQSTPVQVSRLQGGSGEESVTTSESAPRASLKAVGTRISDERTSQDGSGCCTQNIAYRMPLPTSTVESDGLENTGAISEFSSQMVLKTAGIRNSEETITQDRYGGPKQTNDLGMLVQMRKPERGDLEKIVITPKHSPRLSQKIQPSGARRSKDNNSQGGCGGAREVNDLKVPAETIRPERIGLEKIVAASESSPCTLPRLQTEESDTSKEKVSEEAVGLNVCKEVNRPETCEKKHVTTFKSAPRASLKSVGTRSSDGRISQDGYGRCTENIGHRMPTSRAEKDGPENTGAILEFSPQMVLKNAGKQNSEETISQDRYGGFKQNNELRMLVEMSKLERGDVEKIVTTLKHSPCLSQKLEASGFSNSVDNNSQSGCGGAREVNDPKMRAETNRPERIGLEKPVKASEISPCILPRLKAAEFETSKEKVSKEAVELNVSKGVNRLETCEKKHVTTLESAPWALLESVGTGSRISQDGYGRGVENIGYQMPVPTSRVERDGPENTGAISEFSPQMVLKTAGRRNSEETISQDRYGGFKQNSELRMLVQMSKLERGDVEKIVTTSKYSPCLSQKLEASGLKSSTDNNFQGGCGGVREVNDPKMPAETIKPGRIRLEKSVTASEISPCILPRLKTVETSEENVSEEAVQLNVSKEVNRLETSEKKHVMDVKNTKPEVKILTPSRRRSHVNRQIILEGEFLESRSHQNVAGPVEGVPSSAMDVTGSLTQEGFPNTSLSYSSLSAPLSRRRSYLRRQSASGANSHRRIELSSDLQHPTPSETVVAGPKGYISIQQGGGISEGNRPSDTNCKLSEAVPVQAETRSVNRVSARLSRRRIEPRRVSCPDGEIFRLQKSLSSRNGGSSRHTDSSSDDREFSNPRTERRRIKRTTKPLVWRSRSMQTQDDSD